MPGFDREIARNAQRVLINPRPIDWHTGVLATKVTPGEQLRSEAGKVLLTGQWVPALTCSDKDVTG